MQQQEAYMNSQVSWIVKTDKEFAITEAEYQIIKRAANVGKTMVWFDTFVISIPHIHYMEKIKKMEYPKTPELPEATVDLHKKIGEWRKNNNG